MKSFTFNGEGRSILKLILDVSEWSNFERVRHYALLPLLMAFFVAGGANAQTYEFNNAGATGADGPTQSELDAAYSGTNLDGDVTSVNGYQRWIVPATDDYLIMTYGAEGGGENPDHRGQGGMAEGTVTLNEDDTLYITVGQAGIYGDPLSNPPEGGFGGGGDGGEAGYNNHHGSSGGGASDIRIGDTSLTSRVLVAGGGGGATGDGNESWRGGGGGAGGGGYYGGGGGQGGNESPRGGGEGGTQTAGGSGQGTDWGNTDGSLGQGGHGGNTSYSSSFSTGSNGYGGDGGGLQGEDGGENSTASRADGGGGGSSYLDGITGYVPTGTNTETGVNEGHGLVVITNCTNVPENVAVTDVTQGDATVEWTETGSSTEWDILYGEEGFDPVTEGTLITGTTSNPYTIEGLDGMADYDVYVRSYCNGDKTPWSSVENFYVPFVCPDGAYCFFSAGATGSQGPTQSQLDDAYAGTNLEGEVTSVDGHQQWNVPSLDVYKITLLGAEGGGVDVDNRGQGGVSMGDIRLDENDDLYITVGQAGQYGHDASTPPPGGFGGGGDGGDGGCYHGSSGGGASDIRIGDTSLTSRVLVAGGGGGGTGDGNEAWRCAGGGGGGGGYFGGGGGHGGNENPYAPGEGGTQSSGGTGGGTSSGNTDGSIGQGGQGGNTTYTTTFSSGTNQYGGYGGGLTGQDGNDGGIGSRADGGGGGSSLIDGSSEFFVEEGSTISDSMEGDGIVIIEEREYVQNDLEIVDLVKPVDVQECGDSIEPVYVAIRNNGILNQSNFNIHVDIDGAISYNLSRTYEDTLEHYFTANRLDTFYIGDINTQHGGTANFTVYHDLSADEEPSNDTLQVSRTFDPIVTDFTLYNDTVCIGETATMYGTSPDDAKFTWYASLSGQTAIHEGDSFVREDVQSNLSLFVEVEHEQSGCEVPGRHLIAIVTHPEPKAQVVAESGFAGSANSGTSGDPDLVPNGHTSVYDIYAPQGLSLADYSTEWEVVSATLEDGSGSSASQWSYTSPSGGNPGTVEFTPNISEAGETFTLSLTVENYETGCQGTVERHIEVVETPEAEFSHSGNPCQGSQITFENETDESPDMEVNYTWNLGDGSILSEEGPINHEYAEAGTYTVTLEATSEEGGFTSVYDMEVTVHPVPEASFEVNVHELCAGEAFEFTNHTDMMGASGSHEWRFGDGETSTDEGPSHTYETPGIYTVTLEVETDSGCVDVAEQVVQVHEVPEAEFSAEDACEGDANMFESHSGMINNHFEWDMGDGSMREGHTMQYKYAEAGTYEVTMTETTPQGCSDSYSDEVEVYELPDASFSYDMVEPGIFEYTPAEGGHAEYHWDFGDNHTSTDEVAQHSYGANSTYDVSLRVVSEEGCESRSEDRLAFYSLDIEEDEAGFASTIYPNPTDRDATIELRLSNDSEVRITLLNSNGQQVMNITEGMKSAGSHELIVDSQNLSSGLYLVRFEIDGENYTEALQILE